jgi:hypothetical protein
VETFEDEKRQGVANLGEVGFDFWQPFEKNFVAVIGEAKLVGVSSVASA